MVDKKTFPLYRLPYVVLKIAFACLDTHEILHLSMVSRKSYSICKVFRKKVGTLKVCFLDSSSFISGDWMWAIFRVTSTSEVLPVFSKLESLKIKDTVFQVDMYRNTLDFYCDDRLACLTTLYEYLTDFYEVPLYEVELDGNGLTALDGVLARQQTLTKCHFHCRKSGDEEVRSFLDCIEDRVTGMLILDVSTSEDIRLNSRQPIKTDMIVFGTWYKLSIDTFSELNSRVLMAQKTSLTCEYLNSYLKNWQNGEGNPNLGCLKLWINSINVNTVLNGIEFNRRHRWNNVYYRFFVDSPPWAFKKSYDIKRNDGTIASILMENGQYGYFKFCVWPDVDGTVYPEKDTRNGPRRAELEYRPVPAHEIRRIYNLSGSEVN